MKRVLVFFLILGVVATTGLLVSRYQLESNNRKVELVVDYNLLQNFDQLSILPQLRRLGVTSLAVSAQSIIDLAESEKVGYYWGSELLLWPNSNLLRESIKAEDLYLTGRRDILEQLEINLSSLTKVEITNKDQLLQITSPQEELLSFPVYFDRLALEISANLDFKLIPRVSAGITSGEFKLLLEQLGRGSKTIFAGDKVVGYPNNLNKTAQILREQELGLGMIEPFLARQQGIKKLVARQDYQAVRVHSLQQGELAKLGVVKTANRYLRATKERNVRVLYLKPFANSKETIALVKQLTRRLKEAGYQLASAQPFKTVAKPKYLELLIILGILAGIGLLVEDELVSKLYLIIVAGILLGGLYLINLNLVALVVVILTPVVVVYYLITRLRLADSLAGVQKLYWQANIITVVVGLMIAALLFDTGYLLQTKQFRGIKLAFGMPLILASIYYLYYRYGSWQQLKEAIGQKLREPIKVQEVLVVLILLLGVVIYLGRTGNNPIFGVSEIELIIREKLEQLLVVRPRFKSFLIGHPLLFLGLGLAVIRRSYSWLLLGGLIGQITILNTFLHLHTPLMISCSRVVLGLILGNLIGLLILVVVKKLLALDRVGD